GFFTMAGGAPAARIAKWNGASWSPLGSGVDGGVNTMVGWDDGTGPALYVGGSMLNARGARGLRGARWKNSAWAALAGGITNGSQVNDLCVFPGGAGSALYLVGGFQSADNLATPGIVRWNGSSFSALGGGLDAGQSYTAAVYDDGTGPALYVGGV